MQLFFADRVSVPMLNPVRFRFLAIISASVWLALAAGCSSDPRPENRDGPVGAIPDYPPVMAGTENFADGKIAVQVTLALPPSFRPGDKGARRGGGTRSGRRHPPEGGGMGPGGPPGGMEGGEGPSEGGMGAGPRVTGSTLPPAQLKLHLQNTSTTDPVDCEVVDFNSSLGNFAVFPSRYQIAASQSAISETMTSRLGVEGDEIPVTVALRIRDHVEKKVITLHLLPLPAKSTTAKAP